jgi:hypothetical protein
MKTKSVVMSEKAFIRAAKEEKIGYDIINPQGERLFESRFYLGSQELDVEAHYVAGTNTFELFPKTLLGQLFLSVLLHSN